MRVSFAGGGTDVSPYPETRGGAVLSVAVNRFCHASLTPRTDSLLSIKSLDYGHSLTIPAGHIGEYGGGPLAFLVAALRAAGDLEGGLDLVVASEAAPRSGLGASSAMTVAVLGAIRAWKERRWTDGDIAELAYRAERLDAGQSGGRQDQYAAAFGGFNYFEFLGDRTLVNPVNLHPEVAGQLQANLLLCFTGKPHPEEDLIQKQVSSFRAGDPSVLRSLDGLKGLAAAMRHALTQGDLDDFAKLLDLGWEFKKSLADGITDGTIDEMYQAAMNAGAQGGKLLGSGGGGHLLLFCPPEKRGQVLERIVDLGATEVSFSFCHAGVQALYQAGEIYAN
jgi:D-glycero-alpha-D-manno-heptose-7-phosphate kinase